MNRPELDQAMRDILTKLALCSHIPATSYQPRGRSGATESRDLSGGDQGAHVHAVAYGPPFHQCTGACRHRPPATTDEQRLRVLHAATDEYEHLTGQSAVKAQRPQGETAAERDARIVRDYSGWSVREVAVAVRCGEGDVRRARRHGKVNVDGRELPVDVENGEPVRPLEPMPEQRGRGLAGRPRDASGRVTRDPATSERQARRRRQLQDLVHRRGHSIRQAARMLGISEKTARIALGETKEGT